MRISENTRRRLADVPPTVQVQAALREYMAKTDLSYPEVGERIGYAHESVRIFLAGDYHLVARDDLMIRAAAWEYLQRNPIVPSQVRVSGPLFVTENYRRIRKYFLSAVERHEICLLYGPPGTQKTFVLEHLVAERNREKKNDALYVYASARMTRLAVLKRTARAAGATVCTLTIDRLINGLVHHFRGRPGPPAIVVDEAQHLTVDALEVLRELYDRSGCGLMLAGSHNLFENFVRGRAQLEQWLSRIDHKDPLPGLLETEVREIAVRQLGNGQPAKLGEKQVRALVEACRVDDIFARDAAGKPTPRKYLSVRRLVKVLEQSKARREQVA